MSHVSQNLTSVRQSLAIIASGAGRAADSVTLVAVSKTYPVEAIREAYAAGQRDFGENRVEELYEKKPQLPDDIRWHLIGTLQSRKAANAVAAADLIHSVDSAKLLAKISRAAVEYEKVQEVLLQVNVSGEASKHGMAPELVADVLETALGLPGIAVTGLMTMAPYEASGKELTEVFRGLRKCRDSLQQRFGVKLPVLSMGMSGDFAAAVAEGATLVRIGTAIFGARG